MTPVRDLVCRFTMWIFSSLLWGNQDVAVCFLQCELGEPVFQGIGQGPQLLSERRVPRHALPAPLGSIVEVTVALDTIVSK